MNKKDIFLTILSMVFAATLSARETNDSLRKVLSDEIAVSKNYIDIRKTMVGVLETQLRKDSSDWEKCYYHGEKLFEECSHFESRKAYSALASNISIAEKLGSREKEDRSRLSLACYAVSIGLYYEAYDLLSGVDRQGLSKQNLPLYYKAYFDLYGEMAGYSQQTFLRDEYRGISNMYGDSLLAFYKAEDKKAYEHLMELRSVYNEPRKALDINTKRIKEIEEGTQEFATAAYYRAFAYLLLGETEDAKEWFMRSAITDVRLGVTDNGSIWLLADIAKNEGKTDLSYSYVRYGMENSLIFNAPMRRAQTAISQAVIGKKYEEKAAEEKTRLQTTLAAVAVLAVLLVIVVIILLLLFGNLHKLKIELSQRNIDLRKSNSELDTAFKALSETDKIKEEYVRQFMQMMSAYIRKMEESNRKITKLLKTGKSGEALEFLETHTVEDSEMQDFYKIFDESFLRMFPDFVEKFNSLLRPDARFVLQPGESLPSELRIYALIRLGVTDSAQIAKFLHYSPNTIYNYRSRVKNNALGDRSSFETEVQKI